MATRYRDGYRTAVLIGNVNGKRKYAYFEAPTADEADLLALQFKVQNKKKKTASKMTLGEAVDEYIKNRSAIFSPKTVKEYKKMRDNWLGDLADIPLKRIDSALIQQRINIFALSHSPKSCRNLYSLISATISAFAPELQLSVTLPPPRKQEIKIPSESDVKKLLEAADRSPFKTALLLGAYAGLRRSEVCGLKAKDISSGYIYVHEAVVQSDSREWVSKPPKTYSGTRKIPIPKIVEDHLMTIIKENHLSPEEKVCFMVPSSITHAMAKTCEKAGTSHFRFHDLRHFFASQLHALGIPDLYAINLTGHKTTNMLKAVYQHIVSEKEQEIHSTLRSHFDK